MNTQLQCRYAGSSGPLRTWCRHPEKTGDRPSLPVLNSTCEDCPLKIGGEQVSKRSCIHRGEVVGVITSGCVSCNGHPVYKCEVHGKAVVTKRQREDVKGARPCEGCPDYKAV